MSCYSYKSTAFLFACLFIISFSHAADLTEQNLQLETIVITAEQMDAPLTIVTDPKAPRQPLPAHDGADYLKTVPGFSVTRKGGTDGDPLFRSMAASRVGILVDNENILGGCSFRMDAPTAYIFPELYDLLTIIKGPQTVQYGPGNSAATVRFERDTPRFEDEGFRLHASALAASADRRDELVDLRVGNEIGYLQLSGSDSTANDYRDGNGDKVHSEYHRYNVNVAVGWTPDENTTVEIYGGQSDGEAAYADRSMDGTQFLRESSGIKMERKNINPLLQKIALSLYVSDVDHIMDDQELRTPGMMGYSNLIRETDGGRFASDLVLNEANLLTLGIDTQNNEHRSRSAPAMTHVYTPWQDDSNFNQLGFFAELAHQLDLQNRLILGYRADRWEVTDERAAMIMTSMMPPIMSPNPSSGETRKENLSSGFARYELTLPDQPTILYAGVGHSERFPDYWEMIAKQSATSASAFDLEPEVTDQLDVGLVHNTRDLDFSVSLFYSKIRDYILIDYSNMLKMNGFSRNVDATTYGGELGAAYALSSHWKLESSLAWVWGQNDTDNTALAQVSPLEGRVSATYHAHDWSAGVLMRAVDNQNRYDTGRGTIVGQDLATSAGGFTIWSLNGSWQATKDVLLTTGVDNLLDKNYAEQVSRAGGNGMGGAIPGYIQTDRVNEPGRTLWLKVQLDMEF